jgi:anthranilate phosphoribosyltransferase
MKAGITLAREAIDSGAAQRKLEQLVSTSKALAT